MSKFHGKVELHLHETYDTIGHTDGGGDRGARTWRLSSVVRLEVCLSHQTKSGGANCVPEKIYSSGVSHPLGISSWEVGSVKYGQLAEANLQATCDKAII